MVGRCQSRATPYAEKSPIALGCNRLIISILQHSKQDLIGLLRARPRSIIQANNLGQTPLHLAVFWPEGLQLLLRNGAYTEICDGLGRKPLEYAIQGGCVQSVTLLMKAGCSLELRDLPYVRNALSLAIGSCPHEGDYYSLSYRRVLGFQDREKLQVEIRNTVILLLAERRRDLHARFVTSFPASNNHIRLCWDGRVLDKDAATVENSLQIHSPSQPRTSTLLPYLQTVYHVDFLTVELAERLWQAGFRDVDVPAPDGRTPLMLSSRPTAEDLLTGIKLTAWLVRKGANIHRPQYLVSRWEEADLQIRRALHFVAARIGRSTVLEHCTFNDANSITSDGATTLFRQFRNLTKLGLQSKLESLDGFSKALVVSILSDPSYDHCRCACSSQGCLASTMMLKTATYSYACRYQRVLRCGWSRKHNTYTKSKFFSRPSMQKRVERECDLLATDSLREIIGPSHDCWSWLAKEVIRFQTFQILELKHTCCRGHCKVDHSYQGYERPGGWQTENGPEELDSEEIDEIQDEDREGLQVLESLLQEFEEHLGKQDIIQFIDGYWSSRMNQVLEKRDRAKVDNQRLRQIGVIPQPDETDNSIDEDSDIDCDDVRQFTRLLATN